MNNMIKQSYPAFIIVFVIAFLLGYGTSARIVNRPSAGMDAARSRGEITAAEEGSEGAESALAQISGPLSTGMQAVSADDQPAGNTVSVIVKTGKDAWVAVHEDTGGKPGNILGARLFTTGTAAGRIELLRRLMAGRKYYAMLHADDGDRLFDHTKDLPFVSSAGGAIADDFLATDAPAAQ